MPFQSEKQRRYLHANHPEIAKRWERDYAHGGILDINESEEIIDDGGNEIELTDYNAAFDDPNDLSTGVKSLFRAKKGGQAIGGGTITGEPRGDRTGFGNPFGYSDAPAASSSSSSSGGGDAGHLSHNVPQSLGGTKPDTVTRDSGDAGHLSHNVPVSQGGTKPDKVGGRNMLGDYDPNNTTGWKEKGLHIDSMGNETNPVDRGEMSAKDYNEFLTETVEYINPKTGKLTKYTKKKKFGQPYEPPKKKSGFWGTLGKGLLTAATFGLLGPGATKLAQAWNTGQKFKTFADTKTINFLGKEFDLTNHFNKTKSILNKQKDSKLDLYKALPDGHPEKIALQAELEIGKKTTPDVPDRDGKPNIKIEEIETVNDANADKVVLEQKYQEMDEASLLAWQRQQEMQAKKEAYLRNFRNTYVMASQGGRVPAGYNTGGLSNLFRLKNR